MVNKLLKENERNFTTHGGCKHSLCEQLMNRNITESLIRINIDCKRRTIKKKRKDVVVTFVQTLFTEFS